MSEKVRERERERERRRAFLAEMKEFGVCACRPSPLLLPSHPRRRGRPDRARQPVPGAPRRLGPDPAVRGGRRVAGGNGRQYR